MALARVGTHRLAVVPPAESPLGTAQRGVPRRSLLVRQFSRKPGEKMKSYSDLARARDVSVGSPLLGRLTC